jgi:hypothetical protein
MYNAYVQAFLIQRFMTHQPFYSFKVKQIAAHFGLKNYRQRKELAIAVFDTLQFMNQDLFFSRLFRLKKNTYSFVEQNKEIFLKQVFTRSTAPLLIILSRQVVPKNNVNVQRQLDLVKTST